MCASSTTSESRGFSTSVRTELAAVMPGPAHCRRAELAGLLALADVRFEEDVLCIRTDREQAAEKCAKLLEKCFGISAPAERERGGRGRSRLLLSIREAPDQETLRTGIAAARSGILQKRCCCRSYLRGAFLAAGSVSDPNRSYHLEIICSSEAEAEMLRGVLAECGVRGRITRRKTQCVVYIKEGDDISDVLGLMGARTGLMELENARILRDMRSSVNRKVNCEAANISKTVNAAIRQIEDIELIDRTIGLAALPNGLDEMARVRLQYPESTLTELGNLLNPPVGKSGVNHRLRKLTAIAERLRG